MTQNTARRDAWIYARRQADGVYELDVYGIAGHQWIPQLEAIAARYGGAWDVRTKVFLVPFANEVDCKVCIYDMLASQGQNSVEVRTDDYGDVMLVDVDPDDVVLGSSVVEFLTARGWNYLDTARPGYCGAPFAPDAYVKEAPTPAEAERLCKGDAYNVMALYLDVDCRPGVLA
jgi:hypothetical protein